MVACTGNKAESETRMQQNQFGVKSLALCDHGLRPNLTTKRAFADVDNHRPGVLVDNNAPVDGELKLLSSEDYPVSFSGVCVWGRMGIARAPDRYTEIGLGRLTSSLAPFSM